MCGHDGEGVVPALQPHANGTGYEAWIPHLDLSSTLFAGGFSVRGPIADPTWETRTTVRGMGRNDTVFSNWDGGSVCEQGAQVAWTSPVMTVEYVLSEEGVRQNFIVSQRIAGSDPLQITLDITTPLCPELEGTAGIAFRNGSGEFVHAYRGLLVWDACGTSLSASMVLNATNDGLIISVNDKNAVYPLTVDPVATTASRILTPPIGGLFGWSVASAGDVNGDGYSDVVVGAYTASSGQPNEGLAYVYYGSANGIPAAPSVVLQCDRATSNFGFAVDGAGDVNADGFSDVIIGASIWDNDASTLKEGAAFIYHGSAAGLSTIPAVILQSNSLDKYLGYSVAGLGDINGDGFSDVGCGGHLASYGQANEGAAWIYLGSTTGLNPVPRHQLERNQGAAQFGGCVSPAGDVNGDGFNDVIIGAHKFELNPGCGGNTCDDGAIFVYHGSANALGAGLNPNPILIFNTFGFSFRTGWAVSTAGDVNGDGYSDVIIGDWRDNIGPELNEGVALVYHGSAAGVVPVPVTIIQPNVTNAFLGRGVSTAGDVNGDGYADVIIGCTQFANGQLQEGAAFLHLGSPTGIASSAFIRYESNFISAQMGESVSTAGDVNGDGYSDMIVGISAQGSGITHIYHGGTLNVAALPSFTRSSGLAAARLGDAVANAGDLNGDGYSDAIFGAPDASNGQANEGLAFVHYGSITGLSPAPALILEANLAGAAFGTSVASAGDVNGDGYADALVGAPLSGGIGRVYLYLGSPGGLVSAPALILDGTPGSDFGRSVFKAGDVNADGYSDVVIGVPGSGVAFIHLGSTTGLDNVPHATLNAIVPGSSFGAAVGTAGDVNGDGFSDVIIGAPTCSNPQAQEGAAYVYLGDLFDFPTAPQATIEGNVAGYRLGSSVAGAGDVNGNGFFEVVVGAPGATLGEANEGAAFIYYGTPAGTTLAGASTIQSNQIGANMGTSVAEAGDVNGDGYADIVIGVPNFTNAQANEGRLWVVQGAPAGIGPVTTVETNIAGDRLGTGAAGGGDVDGDGYSDVMGGAPTASPTLANEGTVLLYRGNNALSLNRLSRQYLTDLVSPLSTNSADFTNNFFFGVGHRARSPIQRTVARLRWEVVNEGQAFNGVPITNSVASSGASPAWTDIGLAGFQIRDLVPKVPGFYRYKWRVRVEYPIHKMIDGQRFSRWFYGYASAVGDIGILPIELVRFEGLAQSDGNSLSWTTASEQNSAYFLVERSADQVAFQAIGSVAAAGSSSALIDYDFLDASAPNGLSYYRLRMVDRNGSEEFSPTIAVVRDGEKMIIYPVPVDDVLHWSMADATATRVVIRDALGRTMLEASAYNNQVHGAAVQRLATGTYTLMLLDETGNVVARARFVKR